MFFSKSNNKMVCIPLLVISFVTTAGVLSFAGLMGEKSFLLMVFAQEFPKTLTNSSNITTSASDGRGNSTLEQKESKIVMVSGHFANNQIKGGVVTWIQGGLWNLDIKSVENKDLDTTNMTADFDANFTMIKPDGSLIYNHKIDNFNSGNVIFAGNDIVVVGTSDILSDNGTEYAQVPITVHLMGKKVLGLMIDVNKTGGHFSGDNEMFGTLISGVGLDESDSNNTNTNRSLTVANSSNSSITNTMAQMTH